MANPPYTGAVLILYENQDGVNVRVYQYNEVSPGTPIPKGVIGLENSLFSGLGQADTFVHRHASTRSALKTAFGNFVDNAFPDTPA